MLCDVCPFAQADVFLLLEDASRYCQRLRSRNYVRRLPTTCFQVRLRKDTSSECNHFTVHAVVTTTALGAANGQKEIVVLRLCLQALSHRPGARIILVTAPKQGYHVMATPTILPEREPKTAYHLSVRAKKNTAQRRVQRFRYTCTSAAGHHHVLCILICMDPLKVYL